MVLYQTKGMVFLGIYETKDMIDRSFSWYSITYQIKGMVDHGFLWYVSTKDIVDHVISCCTMLFQFL